MINFTQMIYRKYFRNRNCWSEVKIKSAPFFQRGDSDMSAVHQRRRRRYQHASEAFHQRQRSRPSFKRCKTFFGMCGGGGLYVCNLAEKNGHSTFTALCRKGICKIFAVHTLQKKYGFSHMVREGDMLAAEISFYATCLCWSTAQQIFLRV